MTLDDRRTKNLVYVDNATADQPRLQNQQSSRAINSLLRVAVRIVERLETDSLLYVAEDDERAAKLASVLRQLAPNALILYLPSSDALPGDDAPSSPANAGQRVAVLRRLAECQSQHQPKLLACITSAEATAQLYAPPASF